MARVFLSYAREDLKRARSVAAALEKAGHQVWWDRQLVGGSEYSTAIDAALADADAVVVLWSKTSVASPWVRDEAAKGRDTGRLVPATIDGAEPPLGFRQFHTIDLTRRSGRTELVRALAHKRAAGEAEAPLGREESKPLGKLAARPAILVAALVALLAIGFLGWRVVAPSSSADRELALAIMPFDDMSPRRDQAALGEGVAEEIMTLVSGTPGLRVIGRTSTWQLRDRAGDLDELRSRLGATHLLEGSIRTSADELRVAARLVETDSGEELWSEEFRRPMSDIFAVQEQIGVAVAEQLRGTFAAAKDAQRHNTRSTSPEAYKLYLAAKGATRRATFESVTDAQRLLQQALAIDPGYAPAHAAMALTYWTVPGLRPSGPGQFMPEETKKGLWHARRAIELDPNLADGHAALAALMADNRAREAVAAARRAVELDPNNYLGWRMAAAAHSSLCQYRPVAEAYRRAAALEPLLAAPHHDLIGALTELGKTAEAREVAASFSAVSPDKGRALEAQGFLAWNTGRVAESNHLNRQAIGAGNNRIWPQTILAYGLNAIGRKDEAVAELPNAWKDIVVPYWRGDYRASAAAALATAGAFWNSYFVAPTAIKALVHSGQQKAVLASVEGRWGSIRNFAADQGCDINLYAPTMILALRSLGRADDANFLLRTALAVHERQIANGRVQPRVDAHAAALAMLRGNPDEALGHLDRAVSKGWRNQYDPWSSTLHDPVFDPIRSDPRFQAVERRIAEDLAAQVAELERAS